MVETLRSAGAVIDCIVVEMAKRGERVARQTRVTDVFAIAI